MKSVKNKALFMLGRHKNVKRALVAVVFIFSHFPARAKGVDSNAVVYTAKIDDRDGYTNIRLNPRSDARIIGKFTSAQIFYADRYTRTAAEKVEWLAVSDGQTLFGFIHKSRVKFLEKAPNVFMKYGGKIGWSIDNQPFRPIAIFIETKEFKTDLHKVNCDTREGKRGCLVSTIDGRKPYGLDGNLPQNMVSSIVVFSDGLGTPVSSSIYSDLYEVNFSTAGNNAAYARDLVQAWTSQDGDHIMLVLDSEKQKFGRYTATIIVGRNGESARFIGGGYGHGAPLD